MSQYDIFIGLSYLSIIKQQLLLSSHRPIAQMIALHRTGSAISSLAWQTGKKMNVRSENLQGKLGGFYFPIPVYVTHIIRHNSESRIDEELCLLNVIIQRIILCS